MVSIRQPRAKIRHHTSYDPLRLPRTSHGIPSFEMNILFLMKSSSTLLCQSGGYVQRPLLHHRHLHHLRASLVVDRRRPRPQNVVRARQIWLVWWEAIATAARSRKRVETRVLRSPPGTASSQALTRARSPKRITLMCRRHRPVKSFFFYPILD